MSDDTPRVSPEAFLETHNAVRHASEWAGGSESEPDWATPELALTRCIDRIGTLEKTIQSILNTLAAMVEKAEKLESRVEEIEAFIAPVSKAPTQS